ncbi:MAG: autotransporter outer membrane beta-barrel domain-containing protein [Ectothiorhodospiraceae bacterium]|nr:autotransporter outer membrane beta-barrel domain-containing protein [Ectothiorhodospiraceae bacterium]
MHKKKRSALYSPLTIMSSSMLALGACLLLGLPPPAHAQSALQARTETAVRAVCGNLAANPDLRPAGSRREDLFFRCREMVHGSNALGRGDGPEAHSIGLDADALDAAFQQLAAEETLAPGAMVTEFSGVQSAAVLGRISALQGAGAGLARAGESTPQSPEFPVLVAFAGSELSLGYASDQRNNPNYGWGRFGVFANGSFGFGERDATSREDGFDFDTFSFTAGADYRVTPETVLGGALGYSKLKADFHKSAEVAGGDVEGESWTILGYGLYNRDDFFIHGLLGHSWTDFDIKRRIVYESGDDCAGDGCDGGANRNARADTDGRQFQASVGTGYGFQQDAWRLTPGIRVEYLRARIDSYRERGAEGLDLEVQRQTVESFTSAVGAQLAYTVGLPFAVLIPQARAEWIHEFSNSGRRVETRYVNDPDRNVLAVRSDDPDRDYFRLGVGVSLVTRTGTQAYLDYETLQGLKDIESHQITAGIRLEF